MKKLLLFLIIITPVILYSQPVWIEQTAPPNTPPLNSVYAYSSNIAWISGEEGTVLYTNNGGTSWIHVDPPQGIGYPIIGINAINTTTALCLVNTTNFTGMILRTSNSGNSWNTVFTRTNQFLYDMKFINAQTGYVYGEPLINNWFFIKTTNGGISWDTTVTRPPAIGFELGFQNSMYVLDVSGSVKIWFGTDDSKVVYSPNGGLSWQTEATGNGNNNVRGVTFLDANTGFCCGDKCFKSTNNGNFWVNQPTYPLLGNCFAFANVGGFVWYTTGSNICYSTNTGVSFAVQHTSPDNSNYYHLSFVQFSSDNNLSTITGWGVTNGAVISKLTHVNIGIQQINTEIPKDFGLKQNYPNPFNPSTKIRFSVPRQAYLSINVYDILGRLVKNVFKGSVKPGNYETDFDASELSSGMYFYKLESEKFSDVKKMVVVK